MGDITSLTADGQNSGICVLVTDVAIDDILNPQGSLAVIQDRPVWKRGGHLPVEDWSRLVSRVSPTGLLILAVRGKEPGLLFRLKDGRYLTKDL